MFYRIEKLLRSNQIESTDLFLCWTPCQAFSLAGLKQGLKDQRANLTLKLIDILNANDMERKKKGKTPSVLFWENVEGVLRDKTNVFACFIAGLTGLSNITNVTKWPPAGVFMVPREISPGVYWMPNILVFLSKGDAYIYWRAEKRSTRRMCDLN